MCFDQPSLRDVDGLAQISRKHVSDLVNDLSKAKLRRGKCFSPGTVRRHVMELSGLLTHALKADIIDRHPVRSHDDIPAGQRSTALDPNRVHLRAECARLLNEVLPSTILQAGPSLRRTRDRSR